MQLHYSSKHSITLPFRFVTFTVFVTWPVETDGTQQLLFDYKFIFEHSTIAGPVAPKSASLIPLQLTVSLDSSFRGIPP